MQTYIYIKQFRANQGRTYNQGRCFVCACAVCALPAAAFGGSALGLPGWEGRLGNGSIEDSIISFCLSSLNCLTLLDILEINLSGVML